MDSNTRNGPETTPTAARLSSSLDLLVDGISSFSSLDRLLREIGANKLYRYADDILMELAMDDEFVLQFDSYRIRYKTDRDVSKRWFWSKFRDGTTYEGPIVRLMSDRIQPGDFALDVGAHIGYFTNIASHLVGPSGSVQSYEIGPETYELLKVNVAHGSIGNVSIHHAGIADKNEMHEIGVVDNPTSPSHSLANKKELHDRTETVPVRTLDGIAEEFGVPDCVKMDIEGAELSALRGAKGLLADSTPDIICEVHPNGPKSLADFGDSLDELYDFVAETDVEIYSIVEHRSDYTTCTLQRVTGPEDISEAIFLTDELGPTGPAVDVE